MRTVIQRVSEARVTVTTDTGIDEITGEIGGGVVALIGVEAADSAADADVIAEKIVRLRIFEDDDGKMNRSVADTGGSVLAISQFTLLGDCRKGRRPGFTQAADPAVAEPLFEQVVRKIRSLGIVVETGRFRTHMRVALVNDGPATFLLDSRKRF